VLQIAPQPGRRSCVGLTVVRQHSNGRQTITRGTHRLGIYDDTGQPMDAKNASTAAWKTPRTRFPQPAGLAMTKRSDHMSNKSGQITCQQHTHATHARRTRTPD
jgi:hypothetical protein